METPAHVECHSRWLYGTGGVKDQQISFSQSDEALSILYCVATSFALPLVVAWYAYESLQYWVFGGRRWRFALLVAAVTFLLGLHCPSAPLHAAAQLQFLVVAGQWVLEHPSLAHLTFHRARPP